ncbi:peroxisomal membrane protein 2 isoform X2 [Canis lupus familiaris]|uniref:peroxisomal membrane protein 2 isoform X2 n=1 Tax=Canis lupus dingo TaxID=286419 RepID=UPI0015F17DA1|nr:peroxisomal membrane protein 2 isoform X2 [Canis lupus dingo]XP_038292187.1 peroxisomal membrane protein 2 isoform X2 [Canis lupus familiaris]XP_038315358.1 peroxisomal membrane protein 2 isoform X2 [Canis lupus familiaris]
MAPAASRLRAGAGLRALLRRALVQYLRLLRLYPVLTKATTSGILSALGNFLAQMIEKKREKENCSQKLDVSGPLRYAIYGFFFTGPLNHFFYLFMEHWIPPEVPLAGVKRLLLDRLLFAPAFLLLFFLIMNFLEVGLCHSSLSGTAALNLASVGGIERVCELFSTLKLKFFTSLCININVNHSCTGSKCWSTVRSHKYLDITHHLSSTGYLLFCDSSYLPSRLITE